MVISLASKEGAELQGKKEERERGGGEGEGKWLYMEMIFFAS